MTPENVRFHAAGHLAAAHLLAQSHPEAAKAVLGVVGEYLRSPRVSSPPVIGETLEAAMSSPKESLEAIKQLEAWFVDPFNSIIEKSGAKF